MQALIGPYLWMDLSRVPHPALGELRSGYKGENILFLTSSEPARLEV